MNGFAKAVAAAGLAVALVLSGSLAASANNTSTVDYAEWDSIKLGDTSTRVNSVFDSTGRIYRRTATTIEKEYQVAYGDRAYGVYITYAKRDAVWRMIARDVDWGIRANQGLNPATKTEYDKLTVGMSITTVRSIIGSSGSRVADMSDASSMQRLMMWPVSTSRTGHADVFFMYRNGTFVLTRKQVTW